MGGRECRFLEGHVDRPQSAAEEPRVVGVFDMMRADPGEHLAVDASRVCLGEGEQLAAECRFGMAAGDVAVELCKVVLLAKAGSERSFAGGSLTDANHVGPAALVDQCRRSGGEVFVGHRHRDAADVSRLGGDRNPKGLGRVGLGRGGD